MITYYDSLENVTDSYLEKPNRPFHKFETHCIDTDSEERTDNNDFSEEESVEHHLFKIRTPRNDLLGKTDRYALPDSPLTETQRQKVLDYRKALRDLPSSIKENGFTDTSLPKKPACLSDIDDS